MTDLDVMKKRFDAEVRKIKSKKGKNHQLFTKAEYLSFLNKVKASKNKVSRKTPEEYQRLSRYDVEEVDNVQRLVVPKMNGNDKLILFTYLEEIFDIIHVTHISIGHGGRNKMMKTLKNEYKNITVEIVIIYLNLCQKCQKKPNVHKKSVKSSEFMSRCQVDIFDMQSQADGDYKFIMVHQDLVTKFVQLKALKSNSPEEVAHHLLDIFTTFGAPFILHSDNGRAFVDEVIKELNHMWSELKILNGKPQHGKSQKDLVEEADPDIKNMVSKWLDTSKSTKWAEGLKFIQLMKNKTHHPSINRSPYEVMFGHKATVDLKSFLLADTLSSIKTEEELIMSQDKLDQPEPEHTESIKEECSSDEYTDTDRYFVTVEHPIKIEPGTFNEQNYVRQIKEEPVDNDSMDVTINTSLQETQKAEDSVKEQATKLLKRSNSSPMSEIYVPIKVERSN